MFAAIKALLTKPTAQVATQHVSTYVRQNGTKVADYVRKAPIQIK